MNENKRYHEVQPKRKTVFILIPQVNGLTLKEASEPSHITETKLHENEFDALIECNSYLYKIIKYATEQLACNEQRMIEIKEAL